MTLLYDYKVPMPSTKITFIKHGNITYAYFITKSFRNSKGQPDNSRTLIGKAIDDNKILIPNDKYFELFNINKASLIKKPFDISTVKTSVYKVGLYILIDKIVSVLGLKKNTCICLLKRSKRYINYCDVYDL